MSNGHVCCLSGVCCPPEAMAVQISEHFGVSLDAGKKIAGEVAVLVPRELPPTNAQIVATDHQKCVDRLAKLKRHAVRELIDIYAALGLDTSEEG